MQHDNDNNQISFVSMFSGIEAASVAFGPLGWRAICFAEIEKFPSAVLAHHYPNTPNVGDMSAHDWSQYAGKADIVCGGPPCQAFSVAGLRQSLGDVRGNLSLVYMKALHAIKPRNAIIENVPGWLSTKDNAFGCFLAGLVGATDALPPPAERSGKRRRWPNAGMVAGPKGRAAWRVLDAQYFGLAQRRKRVIVVADFGNGADPAAVLFEPESVRRDSPPSRETGQGVAPTISARTKGGGGLGTDFDLDGGLIPAVSRPLLATGNDSFDDTLQTCAPEMARCDTTREGSSQDYESTTMVAVGVTGPISHALKSEGADASEDGTGRGTPIICFSAKDYGADASNDLAPTLRAGWHTTSHANAGVMPAIASGGQMSTPQVDEDLSQTLQAKNPQAVCTVALRGREGGATAELGGEVATDLRASSGGGDKPHVLAYAPDLYPTLSASEGGTLTQVPPIVTSAVRRLTPVECERLQGFPDNYTRIPYRNKPAEQCPDGPRYKALGNSWAVPLFNWLGKRIARLMPPVAANDNNKQDIASAA